MQIKQSLDSSNFILGTLPQNIDHKNKILLSRVIPFIAKKMITVSWFRQKKGKRKRS